MKPSKIERELLERLKEIETRLAVLEALPVPIVFAIGQIPNHVPADMSNPSSFEH